MTRTNFPERYNAINERIKYRYRMHIRRVGRKDEKTIIAILKHLRTFEIFIKFEGFETFCESVADKYIQSLFKDCLSLSFITGNLRALKDFLCWLERQRGFRSKINYNHIEYLNLSNNQRKEAKATNYKKAYNYNEIIDAIRQMPDSSIRERRDKALISLQAICTLRITELRTVKIQNIIEEDGTYFLDANAKSMKTKFAKSRIAAFISLPNDIQENVLSWWRYLKSIGFKDGETLFPVIDNRFNQNHLLEEKLKNDAIKSDTTIRNIFKRCFEDAGYEYINPHSFRTTLARFAQTQSPEFLNAVRQNLGHSSIDTTLNSYGQLSNYDQRRAISEMKFK